MTRAWLAFGHATRRQMAHQAQRADESAKIAAQTDEQ